MIWYYYAVIGGKIGTGKGLADCGGHWIRDAILFVGVIDLGQESIEVILVNHDCPADSDRSKFGSAASSSDPAEDCCGAERSRFGSTGEHLGDL